MSLGPEFSVLGNRFQEKCRLPHSSIVSLKRRCVFLARLFRPRGSGGGRGGRAADWGKGCLFPARILITGSAMSLKWVKPSDKTVLTAAVGADKTLKQGVNPA